jgi:bacterioferritin-associated ferredoxin
VQNISLNASDVAIFATMGDPDRSDRGGRYVCQLQWRRFLDALNIALPQFHLGHIVRRFARDPQLAEQTLSDGSRCGDCVEYGINHDGWLTMLSFGAKSYDRDGRYRPAAIEESRLRGAFAVHAQFFGAIADCPDCQRALKFEYDAVIPQEIRDVAKLDQLVAA